MATERRLIDANALLEEVERIYLKHYQTSCYQFIHDLFTAVSRRIRKSPTVDAVEVVRCKDCKWYQIRQWDNGTPKYDCRKTHALLDVKQDDFCSYGERKDNG